MSKKVPTPAPAPPAAAVGNPLVQKLLEILLQFVMSWLQNAQSIPKTAAVGDRRFLTEHRVLRVQGGRKVGYSPAAIAVANQAKDPVLYLVNPTIYRGGDTPTFRGDGDVKPLDVIFDPDEMAEIPACGLVVVDASGIDVSVVKLVDATSGWLASFPKLAYVIVG